MYIFVHTPLIIREEEVINFRMLEYIGVGSMTLEVLEGEKGKEVETISPG